MRRNVNRAIGKSGRVWLGATCLWLTCALWPPRATGAEPSAPPDFDRVIAPLLAARCLDCHRGADAAGGLDLQWKERTLAGGDSGTVLVRGRSDQSELWRRVWEDEMPPEHPLPAEEKRLLREWIEAGAPWGSDPIDPFRWTSETRAGRDWWSLQPLRKPALPDAAAGAAVRNPIDRFVCARLEQAGLHAAPEADRRTLIRRLYLDLLGLPPPPEAVDDFVADGDPAAYEQLVDRLLASPHYGERWARHWLDVVRYGETDGFERNSRRPNAWHYRDWVIRALNADLPYDQFCRLQLCGDVTPKAGTDAVLATGYLVAGVHNTVLGNDQMRAVARQDELEDLIGNVCQTFLGLTANCGRCHDHKFDPISQRDYYRLAAALGGVQHGDREMVVPEIQRELEALGSQIDALENERRTLWAAAWSAGQAETCGSPAKSHAPVLPLAAWDLTQGPHDRVGAMHLTLVGAVELGPQGAVLRDGGYLRSAPLARHLTAKTLEAWVQLNGLDQQGGGVVSLQSPDGSVFDAIVYGEREPARWMAGSENFARTQSFGGPAEVVDASPVHVAVVYAGDGTITCYRNGEPYGAAYRGAEPVRFLPEAVVLIGCRHEPAGGNRMLNAAVLKARVYAEALTPEQIRISAATGGVLVSEADLLARMDAAGRERVRKLSHTLQSLKARADALRPQARFSVYAVVPRQPAETRVLQRGDVNQPGEVVLPGGIAAVGDVEFCDDPAHPEGDSRRKLAEWITGPGIPLFSRVIVNRLWHHHFGAGIVETPSDFGFNGGRPSHPELLDWLAVYLIERRYSLKDVQRLIVTSATYRQSSAPDAAALERDADARLLWRKRPQRQEAEVVRDSLLAAAGLLNPDMHGPGFSDYRVVDMKNGTVYYEPDDPIGAEFFRRSIYRFTPRGANQGLLDVFDCPDPAASTPQRNTTTTPLQALALWNGAFALRMSEHLSAAIHSRDPESINEQIDGAYRAVLQRDPSAEERDAARELVGRFGLRSLCRALFNSNEFLTIP